jgi:hypothetical protein
MKSTPTAELSASRAECCPTLLVNSKLTGARSLSVNEGRADSTLVRD